MNLTGPWQSPRPLRMTLGTPVARKPDKLLTRTGNTTRVVSPDAATVAALRASNAPVVVRRVERSEGIPL